MGTIIITDALPPSIDGFYTSSLCSPTEIAEFSWLLKDYSGDEITKDLVDWMRKALGIIAFTYIDPVVVELLKPTSILRVSKQNSKYLLQISNAARTAIFDIVTNIPISEATSDTRQKLLDFLSEI
jgi:hypothetical protein